MRKTEEDKIESFYPTDWEKIFKSDATNGVNLQNIQTAHKLNIKSNLKKQAEDPHRYFPKDIQHLTTHGMIIIANYQKNENQNNSEISSYIFRITLIQKKKKNHKQQMLKRIWRKGTILHYW